MATSEPKVCISVLNWNSYPIRATLGARAGFEWALSDDENVLFWKLNDTLFRR